MLPSFRDGYLSQQPEGPAEIEQYYATAPNIVEAINQLPDALEIWNRIFEELVKPCVQMIHANQNPQAHQLYKSYVTKLAHSYLETDG